VHETYAGFVDVGFLHAVGAKKLRKRKNDVRIQAAEVVRWFQGIGDAYGSFLRAYWYDGAFSPDHERYHDQRKLFDAIAHTPGVQLRLGHVR